MHKLSALLAVPLLLVWSTAPAQAPKKATAPVQKGATEQNKWKAVWEPANFPKDISLRDVQFLSAEEGWAVGDKNTILHTKDGAKTWQVQLGGDVDSKDRELTEVFFLDAKHGWARGGAEKLLRTSDGGASWQEIGGRLSQHELSMNFVSPQTGFTAASLIKRTDDSGKSWKPVFTCKVDLQIDGLTRKADCYFFDLQFPSPNVGYAVGQVSGANRGVVASTNDGGANWTVSAPEAMEDSARRTFFWNDSTGLVALRSGKTLLTTDGGATWNGIITPFGGERTQYAMPGGQLGIIIQHRKIAYSTNAGRTFSGRDFPVPANVNSMVFPDPKRGYLVGDHGMIYRYHIVPSDYNVKGMIPAPMVGAQ